MPDMFFQYNQKGPKVRSERGNPAEIIRRQFGNPVRCQFGHSHVKWPILQKSLHKKITTQEGKKLDQSVEIRPKSPHVNLATGPDIKVVSNNSHLAFTGVLARNNYSS
ncbi:MAG: hypothetical protein ACJAXZ_003622 [Akkermansiaceae bacterium]|jgi:hypothetical protein